MSEAVSVIGSERIGDILICVDHASNHVPDDIDLQIDARHLVEHIAWDIGVAAIAEQLVERMNCTAILGGVSRLVADFNRDPGDPMALPESSDGIAIPGNILSDEGKSERISRFHAVYHDRIATVMGRMRPSLILSLHSFTPTLQSREVDRPWEIGVLYNQYERASQLAIAYLSETEGLLVGDQEPYSGKQFNATMDRHAEPVGQPYFGIEIRQDLVSDAAGQARFAAILARCLSHVAERLA